jgi:hypothetical protein
MKMNTGLVLMVVLLSVSPTVCVWNWGPKTQEEIDLQYQQEQNKLQSDEKLAGINAKQTEVKQNADMKTKKQMAKAEADKKKADIKAEADKKRIERKKQQEQDKLERSKKAVKMSQTKSDQESKLYYQ